MPIYEYKCAECGSDYEQIRRMADADRNLECPGCRSLQVQRKLSSFATTSGERRSELPMMGCGKTNCCAVTGGGCPN